MRVFIAICTLFSLVLAISVERTQNPDDCSPEKSSGYGYPPPTGTLASPSPTSGPATPTTSGLIPGSILPSTGTFPGSAPGMTPEPAKNGSGPNPDDSDPSYLCHSGPVQCCNTLYSHNHPEARDLVNRVDMNFARQIPGLGSIGVGCSPVVLEGSGSVQCTSQTVCCQNTTASSLIYVGCNIVNIG